MAFEDSACKHEDNTKDWGSSQRMVEVPGTSSDGPHDVEVSCPLEPYSSRAQLESDFSTASIGGLRQASIDVAVT
jgi:Tfp pilus assembly protein FimV